MSKKQRNNINISSTKVPDGHPTRHRPRRNYWGNLYDEDTFDEDRHNFTADSESVLYDEEDDHDSYYETNGYE